MTSSLSALREPRVRPARLPDCPGCQRLVGMCAGTVLLLCKSMIALSIRQSGLSIGNLRGSKGRIDRIGQSLDLSDRLVPAGLVRPAINRLDAWHARLRPNSGGGLGLAAKPLVCSSDSTLAVATFEPAHHEVRTRHLLEVVDEGVVYRCTTERADDRHGLRCEPLAAVSAAA